MNRTSYSYLHLVIHVDMVYLYFYLNLIVYDVCSKRRFKQQEATHWWSKNKDKVLKRYNSQSVGETSSSGSAPPEEEYDDAASQP